MAYRFDHRDDDLEAGMRRIAQAELSGAARLLANGVAPAKAVHEARKSIKKTRALIRLLRSGFPDRPAENAALRDIGHALAPLREADVLETLLAELCAEAGVKRPPPLAGRGTAPNDPESRRADAAEALRAAARRAAGWKVKGKAAKVLRHGIRDTAGAAQATMGPALEAGAAEPMHEFRKRVKDRWYQARLLTAAWPEMMAAEIAAADALADKLGAHHDLAELEERLGKDAPKPLRALIAARSERLLAEIRPLSRRLFAETPEALADRWTGWWVQAAPSLPR